MRRVEVRVRDAADLGVDLLVVALGARGEPGDVALRADRWLGGAIARWSTTLEGRGEEARFFTPPAAELPNVLAVRPGPCLAGAAAAARSLGARAVREARDSRFASVGVSLEGGPDVDDEIVQACAEGLVLGDWSLDELKSSGNGEIRKQPPPLAVIHLPRAGPGALAAAERGRLLGEAQNFARGLVALPANVATPSYLASCAEELGARHGLQVEAWGSKRLAREGFGALLAVARGSEEEPRFLMVEHPGDGGPPVVLVGKGVTFDSGGISLKAAQGMEAMKHDMAGAAAVLGALRATAELNLPRRVVGLIPATENLPSGKALKPGDVIRGVSGRSIEIVSTDAEGRLILSDALSYARGLGPSAVVDIATLTGSCIVALGRHAIGLMSSDDALASGLERAGERTGERVWRLPLWREYRRQIESDVADLKNSGGREASTITAGLFLSEFAADVPWAHLDIAGTAWAEEASGWQPKGATGVGVRLLAEWLQSP